MYLDMIKYYKEEVIRLNNEIENFKGEVYLFGGHIFSQFLIYMGLKGSFLKKENWVSSSKMETPKTLLRSCSTLLKIMKI